MIAILLFQNQELLIRTIEDHEKKRLEQRHYQGMLYLICLLKMLYLICLLKILGCSEVLMKCARSD